MNQSPQLPIISTAQHEMPVPAQRLNIAALREHFHRAPDWQPELIETSRFDHVTDWRTAAVLIPLVMRDEALQVMLTLRTAHLHDHAGQISFPGGRQEAHDANTIETALRETEEETGLSREFVEVLGCLPDYHTVSGYRVVPVVGLVKPQFALKPDSFEVAEVFEVPLSFLMNPSHHQIRAIEIESVQRRFYAMSYPKHKTGDKNQPSTIQAPVGSSSDGNEDHYFIWGATAGMIRNLYHFLKAA